LRVGMGNATSFKTRGLAGNFCLASTGKAYMLHVLKAF
jgi:hypothetical protein